MIFKYLIFILNALCAQDSLFWFDMTSVKDPIPTAPKVLDIIHGTTQLKKLDSLKILELLLATDFVSNYMKHPLPKKQIIFLKSITRKWRIPCT